MDQLADDCNRKRRAVGFDIIVFCFLINDVVRDESLDAWLWMRLPPCSSYGPNTSYWKFLLETQASEIWSLQ